MASGVDLRVGEEISEEVRVTSGVMQGNVLGPLLFLAYVNYIWINSESIIRLFRADCIIYGKILDSNDMENLQIDMNRVGEWALENEIINQTKSKAVSFTKDRVTELLNYLLHDIVIPEESSCKYLGIILHRDLSWADQVISGEKSIEVTSFYNV
jgi:hypothetical protein